MYAAMASIAGAITALSYKKWQVMNRKEVVLGLFVGASFAWFVTPLIVERFITPSPDNARIMAGFTYLVAAGSNVLIPMMIDKSRAILTRWLGVDGDDK